MTFEVDQKSKQICRRGQSIIKFVTLSRTLDTRFQRIFETDDQKQVFPKKPFPPDSRRRICEIISPAYLRFLFGTVHLNWGRGRDDYIFAYSSFRGMQKSTKAYDEEWD